MDLHAILNSLNSFATSIPQSVWDLLIQSAVGAITVSPIALGIKKWFSIDSDRKMLLIVTLGSFVAAAGAYLLTVPKFQAWIILLQGFAVLGMSQPAYYIIVKPAFGKLAAWFTSQVLKAAAKQEATAARVPATGLPIGTPSLTDFK